MRTVRSNSNVAQVARVTLRVCGRAVRLSSRVEVGACSPGVKARERAWVAS